MGFIKRSVNNNCSCNLISCCTQHWYFSEVKLDYRLHSFLRIAAFAWRQLESRVETVCPSGKKTLFWTLQTTFVIHLIWGESNYDNLKCIWMELSANHGTCVRLLLTWRIHEVKVHQIINPQLLQLQHHRAQVRPQDLRIRVVLCQVRGTSESQDHSKCISQDLIISSCVSLICQIAPRHGVRGIWRAI